MLITQTCQNLAISPFLAILLVISPGALSIVLSYTYVAFALGAKKFLGDLTMLA
jgi:hypothetical protein